LIIIVFSCSLIGIDFLSVGYWRYLGDGQAMVPTLFYLETTERREQGGISKYIYDKLQSITNINNFSFY